MYNLHHDIHQILTKYEKRSSDVERLAHLADQKKTVVHEKIKLILRSTGEKI